MHHVLVGVRAWGEALFWGVIGGMAYWVVLVTLNGGGVAGFAFLGFPAVIGLIVGFVTGVVGAFVASVISLLSISDLSCRVVAAAFSATCVAGVCFMLFQGDDVMGTVLDAPSAWWQFVFGPGLTAAVVGAWRGPAIVHAPVPQFVRSVGRNP